MYKSDFLKLCVAVIITPCCVSNGWAQTPPSTSPEKPAQTRTTVPEPCPIPYAIGETLSGGEMEARLANGALSKLAKLPNIGARGGYEVVKTAYAGVSSQAMAAVLAAYGCRVKRYMQTTGTVDATEKSKAIDKAVSWLTAELAQIQTASEQGSDAIKEMKVDYLNTETRPDRAPVLDFAITSAALADIDPNTLFINKSEIRKWLSLDIATYASVSACGGVIKAAISDGGSSLQRALANAKSIFINYLDPEQPPYIALSSLLVSAAASPPKRDSYPSVGSFKGCTDGVKHEQQKTLTTALQAPAPEVAPVPAPASAPKPL